MQYYSDHSIFVHHKDSKVIMLIVYVDDIIISNHETLGVANAKFYLYQHFHTKDLDLLRNFLGIKVVCSKKRG